MLKSLEMKQKLQAMKNEAQAMLDNNKIEDAKAKMKEIKDYQDAIVMQEELEQLQKDDAENKIPEIQTAEDKTTAHKNANIIRAMLKKVTGAPLTQAENDLLLPTIETPEGANGEGYILPKEVQTKIHEKIRSYRSIRDIIGYMPVGALSGSYPVENFETVSELIDFNDGTPGSKSNDISFKNIEFKLKEKAAFIEMSNTLLAMDDNNLIEYVARIFARKAVITENKMGIEALKKDKAVKELASWEALKSSLNVDIDPAMLLGTVILTNQDGYDFLDSQKDANGKPLLQPDPTNPSIYRFKGYTVEVFANSLLPTEDNKAPVFYGNLKEAVNLIDWEGKVMFKVSSEAGFWSNTTIARLIEFVDVEQNDTSDKCYIYGTFPIAANTSKSKA